MHSEQEKSDKNSFTRSLPLKNKIKAFHESSRTLLKTLKPFISYSLTKKIEPVSVAIDITRTCNLRCGHCYPYRSEKTSYEFNSLPQLSDGAWINVLEQLKKSILI